MRTDVAGDMRGGDLMTRTPYCMLNDTNIPATAIFTIIYFIDFIIIKKKLVHFLQNWYHYKDSVTFHKVAWYAKVFKRDFFCYIMLIIAPHLRNGFLLHVYIGEKDGKGTWRYFKITLISYCGEGRSNKTVKTK